MPRATHAWNKTVATNITEVPDGLIEGFDTADPFSMRSIDALMAAADLRADGPLRFTSDKRVGTDTSTGGNGYTRTGDLPEDQRWAVGSFVEPMCGVHVVRSVDEQARTATVVSVEWMSQQRSADSDVLEYDAVAGVGLVATDVPMTDHVPVHRLVVPVDPIEDLTGEERRVATEEAIATRRHHHLEDAFDTTRVWADYLAVANSVPVLLDVDRHSMDCALEVRKKAMSELKKPIRPYTPEFSTYLRVALVAQALITEIKSRPETLKQNLS